MATYLFRTLTAAACLSAAAQSGLCFASDGSEDPGGGGGGDPPAPPAPTVAQETTASRPSRQKMVTATVRHGTVVVGEHGEEEHVGPGGQVTLTEAEVAKLRARGVLHDPDSAPQIPAGPTVDNDLVEPKVHAPRTKAPASRAKR